MAKPNRLKNESFWFLLAAVFISIALRWPTVSHETGIDSFYIHSLATSISEYGEINWEVNFLSYFGMYPMSYPSGMPILLSEFSQMTGIAIETTILIFTFLSAVIATAATFTLALEIRRSPLFAFGLSVAYSICPFFMFLTHWEATSRGIFMAIVPITLWLLIRIEKQSRHRLSRDNDQLKILIIIAIADLILMALLHRLIFMLGLFIIAFFVAKLIVPMQIQKRIDVVLGPKKSLIIKAGAFVAIIIGSIVFTILIAESAGWFGLETYEEGYFEGDSGITKAFNLIVSIGASVGYPLAFLFPIGVLIVLRRKKKGFPEIFFIVAFLLLLPFSGGRTYERLLYPAIIYMLIFLPIFLTNKKKTRNTFIKILIIIFALTIPFNLILVNSWYDWPEDKVVNDGNAISDDTYMTALFMRAYFDDEHFIGNNWIANIRIQAFSSCPEIPNAMSPLDANNVLIYGVLNEKNMQVERLSLEDILAKKGVIFRSDWSLKPENDWISIFLGPFGLESAIQILEENNYNATLCVEDQRANGKVIGWSSLYLFPLEENKSKFLVDLHQYMYKVYDSGREYIWIIEY